jgi:hypothetical protein
MNLKQIAKLVSAGVLAMAVAPAMSLARTHHPVQAAPSSLSATTVTTPKISKAKHAHTSLVSKVKPATHMTAASHKHTALVSHSKHKLLSTRAKHAVLSTHKRTHATLSATSVHKSTKLSAKKKAI